VRIVVVGPRVQADQGDTVRTDGRRKHRLHLKVTLPGECRDRHRVVAGVLAVASTDVGVGVDPDDREIVPVPASQRRERGDAHRALAAEGRNPGGVE
jgi:hypothetical protein